LNKKGKMIKIFGICIVLMLFFTVFVPGITVGVDDVDGPGCSKDPEDSGESGQIPSGEYLIITHPHFENSILPLAEWHNKEGLKTEILSIDTDNPINIKEIITTHFQERNLQYVLLVGDVEYIPIYYWDGIPSDYWYACITGGANPDLYADIAVGRISANSSIQVENQVAKILIYEKNPPMDNWFKNILLVADKGDGHSCSETYFRDKKEIIRTDLIDESIYSIITAYEPGPVLPELPTYPEYEPLSSREIDLSDLIDPLEDGCNIINYFGHGFVDSWGFCGGFYIEDIYSLENGNYTPIVFNIACLTHKIDNDNECLGEAFMNKYPGGAIASLGGSGIMDGFKAAYEDYEFFRQIFHFSNYRIGLIIKEGLTCSMNEYPFFVNNCKKYILLGDPATEIWTDIPSTLEVSYPSVVRLCIDQPVSFTVHVGDDAGNVDNATVCLWKDDEIYLINTTNSDGYATFNLSPSTTGTMFTTISKHNYIPYEGEVNIETMQVTVFTQ